MKLDDNPLTYEEIEDDDVDALTTVMTRAFDDDAQKHLGEERGGPPGYDDGEFFRTWLFAYEESVGFKILAGDTLIGGIIVWILPEKHNVLGTIFVDPEWQDMGVGERTWRFIEEKYPDTKSWRLATPSYATKNHHFYAKCGFSVVDSDPIVPVEEGTTIYRKELVGSD